MGKYERIMRMITRVITPDSRLVRLDIENREVKSTMRTVTSTLT